MTGNSRARKKKNRRREASGANTANSGEPEAIPRSRARKKKRDRRCAIFANAINAGEAIPGLPNHLVVTHILRSEYFDDHIDLARLPAVSRAMSGAVVVTGLRLELLKELDIMQAVNLGCLSALRRMQRRGRCNGENELEDYEPFLCHAAASSGQLEELKEMRKNGCPWDEDMCFEAAHGGQLEVLQWLRANGCPWDRWTCTAAAERGLLEMQNWTRTNGCPV